MHHNASISRNSSMSIYGIILRLRHQIATRSHTQGINPSHRPRTMTCCRTLQKDDFGDGKLSLPALLWATQINRIAHVTADFWHNKNLWRTRRRNSPSFRPSFAPLSVTASSFSCWRSPWAFSAAHQNWCIDAYLMHAVTFDALQKWCNNASNVHQNGLIFDAVAFGRVVDFLEINYFCDEKLWHSITSGKTMLELLLLIARSLVLARINFDALMQNCIKQHSWIWSSSRVA